jgi:citrate synthase
MIFIHSTMSLSFRSQLAKQGLRSVRAYSTAEPTLKQRLAEILPAKAEEVKQLKKEHGKTVCITLLG